MERWVDFHRFALILCASLFSLRPRLRFCGPRGTRASRETGGASYAATVSKHPAKGGPNIEYSGTDQDPNNTRFRMSARRRRCVLAAGYTLYFVSYFLADFCFI